MLVSYQVQGRKILQAYFETFPQDAVRILHKVEKMPIGKEASKLHFQYGR